MWLLRLVLLIALYSEISDGCPVIEHQQSHEQSEQKTPYSEESLLLITGGGNTEVEVLSLGTNSSCRRRPVRELPKKSRGAITFLHEADPVYCAGVFGGPCHKYHPGSNTWKIFGQLPFYRRGPGLLKLGDLILIVGGNIGAKTFSNSVRWNSNDKAFEPGPALPRALAYPCIAAINQTHALLTGGYDGEEYVNEAYMFNKETEEWTKMKPMLDKRQGHACGLIGESEVLIAGGYANFEHITSVEAFNLKTQTWSKRQDLPLALTYGVSLHINETLFIVSGEEAPDRIYEYDAANDKWLLRPETLSIKRERTPAVYKMPEDYVPCA